MLILRAPLLEKVKLNVCSFDPHHIPRAIKRRHNWFVAFSEAVGVRFRVIDQAKPEEEDSSIGEFTDLEDEDDSDFAPDEEWDEYSDDYGDVPSDDYSEDDEPIQARVQCPTS